MLRNFTDSAREAVQLALAEAKALNHNYVGTEHILLGLLRGDEDVAAKALRKLGLSLDNTRQQVEDIVGKGQHTAAGHLPFEPRARKVLQFSNREADYMGHNYTGTGHILLALVRRGEGEGIAGQIFIKLGIAPHQIQQEVFQEMADWKPTEKIVRKPTKKQLLRTKAGALVYRERTTAAQLRSAITAMGGTPPDD